VSEVQNLDEATVRSFGRQWARFDQSPVPEETLKRMFSEYFDIFPWERLPEDAVGADVGCGSGRWARFAAERAATLHCIDASEEALSVARVRLSSFSNVVFHRCSIDALPFEEGSLDFAYSLGVLHHVPDTAAAFTAIARALKKGAPLLIYLYYTFENRPAWYRFLWSVSDRARGAIAHLPPAPQSFLCDSIAACIYWPLARLARVAEAAGIDVAAFPLSLYRVRDFYSMRTDARDRFGTPLEKRFRADEIRKMMNDAGLAQIRFSDSPPYWCALGIKS
jgi:ubiquinone/menaquinone biosynthesis C-methylase UbiE